MFELLHSSRTSGHFGLCRTLGSIRRRFYWPGYKRNIAQWCQTCKVCESYKAGIILGGLLLSNSWWVLLLRQLLVI